MEETLKCFTCRHLKIFEASEYDEVYWATHHCKRFKQDIGGFYSGTHWDELHSEETMPQPIADDCWESKE